jgi:5-methylcytosine-specific restriction protein B
MTEVVALGIIDGPYLAPDEEGNPLTAMNLEGRAGYWAHGRRVNWLIRSPLSLPAGLRKLAIPTITTLPESTLTAILAAYKEKATDPATLAALKELGWKEKALVKPPVSEEVTELLEIAEWTHNIILYGPPGTGKTYTARRFAEAFLEQQLQAPAGSVSGPMSSGGTPRFWWQAVALALAELGSASVPDIEAHPVITAFRSARNNAHVQQTIWQQLLTHTDPGDASSNTASRIPLYAFTKSQTDAWQLTAAGEAVVATLQDHPVPDTALNETDPYLYPVTFHPAFTYEDFVEGLRPAKDGPGLTVRDGIFKRVCTAAREDPDNRYVLLIDEINRADTAKTFGELITLIEDDKRAVAGRPARYEVNLPYSDPPDNRFSVPDNVYIVGTMNTADRSVALMDVALRRRFTFVEVPPATAHLESLDGLSLGGLLSALNARVTRALDRDHAIGHAYLTLEEEALNVKVLRYRWRYKIVPLLQEYFYADQDGLQQVLGKTLYEDATGTKKLSEVEFMQALKALEAEG